MNQAAKTEKDKIKHSKSDPKFNTENMIPISEIRGDAMILKDGGLRGVLRVFGLNLDLRNYEEQQIAIEQYKRFLNGLDFPIQILAKSTYLDLTEYLDYMKDNVNGIENDVLKWQGQEYVNFLDEINSKQGLVYTKEFYIIVPFYGDSSDAGSIKKPWWQKFLNSLDAADSPDKIVNRYRSFQKNRTFLDTRCNLISEGLKGLGVVSERLQASELISLMFKSYNPNSHSVQSEL